MNKSNDLQATNTIQKKNTPTYATHGNTYTILFYLPQAPSHKHLHKHPIKEKRKGVATSLCASSHSTTAFEPVPRASRASRLFAGSLARVVRGSDLCLVLSLSVLAHSSFPCSSRAQTGSGSDTQPSQTTWPQAFHLVPLPSHSLMSLQPSFSCASSRNSPKYSHKTLFTPCPALFWTRYICTRQSGEDTPPLPLPLLASETGR